MMALLFINDIVLRNPREQANAIKNSLRKCGWLEYETIEDDFIELFSLYQQSYLDQELLQTIKVRRKAGLIDEIDLDNEMSEAERESYLSELRSKNNLIYTSKKINEYVKVSLK